MDYISGEFKTFNRKVEGSRSICWTVMLHMRGTPAVRWIDIYVQGSDARQMLLVWLRKTWRFITHIW